MLDPSQIPLYSVISIPYTFQGDPEESGKLFVVIGHRDQHLICLKATTRTTVYENNLEMMAGCVYYKKKETVFVENTAIQPENQFPIPYAKINEAIKRKRYRNLGSLPSEFESKLIKAINDSIIVPEVRKKSLLAVISDPNSN